ncbi:putative nuclease HARBI1 [Cucumis melo var. makuwa]|uniref:Nuclease HARBI1 n=1 Tax=Cucumis melo var. makuwa TaxID=1194695 RepID=A0A5A7U3X6_CUCMM|nr:putative nuclease HARBI1 [Cucumis melo var. makuwa]TYK08105.1 putative nuclease HARBI1 [Cucumis melo var. makuwa]
MDPHEIAAVLSAFTIAQRQMLLILEALLHDNKRITHIPVDAGHRIRQLTYFRMIHASDLNCLRALDGTYIKVNVSAADIPRYRTRKSEVATNVLDVCDTNGGFVFILAGWEGSTVDSRILRDALSRPNGLKVSKGYYYLRDAGYPNAEGFLAPYRGQHYHLQEWRGVENAPETPKEFFNMKHCSARNVIERAFGLLKGRWAILRGKSYYLVQVQCRTIMACCLLHNLINREMSYIEELDDEDDGDSTHATTSGDDITYIEPSNEWTEWRDALASSMFTEWQLCNQ